MLVTFLNVLLFLVTVEARIIVSVRGYRKILPHEKESRSYEERVSPAHDYLHRAARLGYTAVGKTGANMKPEPRIPVDAEQIKKFIAGHNLDEPFQGTLHHKIGTHWPEIGAVAYPMNIQSSSEDSDEGILYPPDRANFPFQFLNGNSLGELPMRSSLFHSKLQAATPYNLSRPLKKETDDDCGIVLYLLFVFSCFLMVFALIFLLARAVALLLSRGRVPLIAKPRIVQRPVIQV